MTNNFSSAHYVCIIAQLSLWHDSHYAAIYAQSCPQVLDLIHHLDVLEALIAEGVSSLGEWMWTKQFCYYRLNATAVTARMADAMPEYSWEYQGNAPKLVHTPLTDKCYLTLTQVSVLSSTTACSKLNNVYETAAMV